MCASRWGAIIQMMSSNMKRRGEEGAGYERRGYEGRGDIEVNRIG